MTNTSADIEAAWAEKIWSHGTILDITPRFYPYDVSAESEFDVEKLCDDGVVNFFLAKTQRLAEPILTQQTRYTFSVEVQYYLQQTDVAESTYQAVRDTLESLDDLVRSELGKTWDGTVDYTPGGRPTPIRQVVISGRQCWTGSIVFTGIKTT